MGLRNCELLHTTADLVRKEAKGTRTARLPIPNPSFLYTERGQPLTRTVKRDCIYRALMTFQNPPFCGRAHVKDDNKRVKGTDCEALRGLMECSLWESTHYFLERGGRVQHEGLAHMRVSRVERAQDHFHRSWQRRQQRDGMALNDGREHANSGDRPLAATALVISLGSS